MHPGDASGPALVEFELEIAAAAWQGPEGVVVEDGPPIPLVVEVVDDGVDPVVVSGSAVLEVEAGERRTLSWHYDPDAAPGDRARGPRARRSPVGAVHRVRRPAGRGRGARRLRSGRRPRGAQHRLARLVPRPVRRGGEASATSGPPGRGCPGWATGPPSPSLRCARPTTRCSSRPSARSGARPPGTTRAPRVPSGSGMR